MHRGPPNQEPGKPGTEAAAPEFLGGLDAGLIVSRVLGGTMLMAICGATLAAFYWTVVGPQPTMIWLGTLLMILTGRIALVAQISAERFLDRRGWPWILLYPVGMTVLCAWMGLGGAWVVWYTPVEGQLLLWLVIVGLCALSVSAIALLQFWLVIAPALVLAGPAVAMFLKRQPGFESVLGFTLLFLGGLGFFYRRQGTLLRQLIASGARNERLVESLEMEVHERREAEERVRRSESEIRTLIQNVRDLIYRLEPDGRIIQVSPSVKDLLGYEVEEIEGMNIRDLLPRPELFDEMQAAIREHDDVLTHFTHEIRARDGQVRWLSANAQVKRDEEGRALTIEGSSRDITDSLVTERTLQRVQDRAQTTLEAIADGVLVTDTRGMVEYLNPVAENLTGWGLTHARGETLARVLRIVDRRTGKGIGDIVQRCLDEGRTIVLSGNLAVRRRGEESENGVEVTASLMEGVGDEESSGVVVVLHDVSRVQDMAKELNYQAAHDRLTGLLNRGELEIRLRDAIESADDQVEHALLYADVDQFKVVNDSCGHAAGDELLRQLADLLLVSIRESDILARMAGDEFGILLEHCPLEPAQRVADTIRVNVRRHRFQWADQTFELSVSIGLVPITGQSGDLTDLLRAADAACHLAKELGRDRVHVYRPDDARLAERQGLIRSVQSIREALEKDRFELHIQTIKPIRDKASLKSGEILLRMRDGMDQLVMPGSFLPAAERYHLMPRIDRWVIRKAFAVIAGRPESLLAYGSICINVSGQSLNDEGFLDFVLGEMEATGVAPEKLCFEITETTVIANLYRARRMISALQERGCLFALDDFGSGLSSFQYLKHLNVNKLKIDGVFIKDVAHDSVDYAMVRAIVDVGRELGIETVAEYVENGETMACIEELGVDHAQGFYIAKPAPIA